MEINGKATPHREAYGPEWEKEIINLSKNALAQMIRRKAKELDALEDQKIQIVGALKTLIVHSNGVNTDGHTRVVGDDNACGQNYFRVLDRAKDALKAAGEEM